MRKFCQTFFQFFISKSYFLLNHSKMKHFYLLFLLYLCHCLSSDPVKKNQAAGIGSLKKPRRVRARRREKSSNHFRRRRVRRRKYFTSCKLREPPRAQAMRSAIGQGEPMQNKVL